MSASTRPRVVIVGGSGKVALALSRLISSSYNVVSLHRSREQTLAVEATGAQSKLLSVEEASVSDLAAVFDGAKNVVWSAGAGGKGGEARTKAVDYEGQFLVNDSAVKVFDAIEALKGEKPHFLLVSALDVRKNAEAFPSHYSEEDKEISRKMRGIIGTYYKYKYQADADLVKRTAFQWTILRPGGLLDEPGTGNVSLGHTHLKPGIPREDVAAVLAALLDRADAAGLALDLVGGETPIAVAVDAALKKGETDWTE